MPRKQKKTSNAIVQNVDTITKESCRKEILRLMEEWRTKVREGDQCNIDDVCDDLQQLFDL